jgi:hypothetical protein
VSVGTYTSSRKVTTTSGGAPNSQGQIDTNMMSFNTSQRCLKNGKLKADDGTILAVNGR